MEFYSQLIVLFNVFIAAVLGGVVGWERERVHKPAGIRTHMIIGASAALLVSVGNKLVESYEYLPYFSNIQSDPLRIMEAIIVGISFIGAGTILKSDSGARVHYLTTAATVLFSAGIGISVALKQYVLSVGLTVLILIINYVIKIIATRSSGE